MAKTTRASWVQGATFWRHDDTGGWSSDYDPAEGRKGDALGPVPSVVLPAHGDLMKPGYPIEVYTGDVGHSASLSPGGARWLAARLLEAAAITEMQSNGAM